MSSVQESVLQDLTSLTIAPVIRDVELANISRWRVGGRCAALAEPSSAEEIAQIMRLLHESETPHCIIGETSNLLFDSAGFDGVIVRIASNYSGHTIDGENVRARAGTAVPRIARAAGDAGLTGIEHTVGIPGTLGGLVLMNGGSQRKGIGSTVRSIVCATPAGELTHLESKQYETSYRHTSIADHGVIVEVHLGLTTASPSQIHLEMDQIVASRKNKFPEDQANCGSTFVSNPAMYAAYGTPGAAIEAAGLKGARLGGAEISTLHANFINNVAGATSDDILGLIYATRSEVAERTGYLMDCEVKFVAKSGTMTPAHVAAETRYRDSPEGAPIVRVGRHDA